MIDFFILDDVESLKSSIRIRYIARIIYEVFSKSDSVALLERYGSRLLEICEQRRNLTSSLRRKMNSGIDF